MSENAAVGLGGQAPGPLRPGLPHVSAQQAHIQVVSRNGPRTGPLHREARAPLCQEHVAKGNTPHNLPLLYVGTVAFQKAGERTQLDSS